MNYTIGHLTAKDDSYQKAPLYFDACWDWHQGLTDDQKDYVLYVIDNFTAASEEHAKRCAARLPPAPGVSSDGRVTFPGSARESL